jgi:hypothetical protein
MKKRIDDLTRPEAMNIWHEQGSDQAVADFFGVGYSRARGVRRKLQFTPVKGYNLGAGIELCPGDHAYCECGAKIPEPGACKSCVRIARIKKRDDELFFMMLADTPLPEDLYG